tara:strand:+ start:1731 stop:2369 length:639 start_codon:yes stop_codon:yes gene_type:complete
MHILKKSILASAIAASSAVAVAEVSMTVGMVSDYIYRGASLGNAGAYGSLDYASGGFYAGIWAISDGFNEGGTDGDSSIEYDLYAGYETEISGVSLGLGYTAYEYSYDDVSESEITISAAYGPASLSYSMANDDDVTSDADFDVMTLGYELGPISYTYGDVDYDDSDDSDYTWAEISAGTEVGAVSIGFTVGENLTSGTDYMVLDVSTGIDL